MYDLRKYISIYLHFSLLDERLSILVANCCYEAKFVQITSPPTVGQDAVELICQSERETQQNATISLWPLFSTEMDLILM